MKKKRAKALKSLRAKPMVQAETTKRKATRVMIPDSDSYFVIDVRALIDGKKPERELVRELYATLRAMVARNRFATREAAEAMLSLQIDALRLERGAYEVSEQMDLLVMF